MGRTTGWLIKRVPLYALFLIMIGPSTVLAQFAPNPDGSAPSFEEYFQDFKPAQSVARPSKRTKSPSAVVGRRTYPPQGMGWLGIKMVSVNEATPDWSERKKATGAVVAAITPNSPAQSAGLKVGDIILRFDDKEVQSARDLSAIILGTPVGKAVAMDVWRDRSTQSLTASIGSTGTGAAR